MHKFTAAVLQRQIRFACSLVCTACLCAISATAAPLNISKDDGLAPDDCVAENGQISYSICYDNTANDFPAPNVVITDTLPDQATFTSADNQGAYDAQQHTVTWNIPSMDPGATTACVHLTASANAPPDTILVNQATITSDATDPNSAEESTTVCPIPVFVDIKPGGCPTPVNVGSQGVLPVAVLGTADFDVRRIEPSSITLAGIPALRWSLEDVATPHVLNMAQCDIHDCNAQGGDGYPDLTLKFDTQAVAKAIEGVRDRDCLFLELRGHLKENYGGTSVRGFDVVSILKKGKKQNPPGNMLLLGR